MVVMEDAAIPAARYMRPMNSGLFGGNRAGDSLFRGRTETLGTHKNLFVFAVLQSRFDTLAA